MRQAMLTMGACRRPAGQFRKLEGGAGRQRSPIKSAKRPDARHKTIRCRLAEQSNTPSPYARKVRIALAEKCIPFELVTEVPWNRTTITPHDNPLEKLPILLLENDRSICESCNILDCLVQHICDAAVGEQSCRINPQSWQVP